MGGASPVDIIGGVLTGGAYNTTKAATDLLKPSTPTLPGAPATPSPMDEAVRNARLMERRKQLGLTGRMSTFLTTAQGESGGGNGPAATTPTVNLLGG